MKPVRLKMEIEKLIVLDGVEKVLETEVSAKRLMTNNINDIKGLNSMHVEEVREEIRKLIRHISPIEANVYVVGKGISDELKPWGCSAAYMMTVTYPITFLDVPYLYKEGKNAK